jgi:hypothetical protein
MRRRQPIEGRIQLDGIEHRRVVREPITLAELERVHDLPPILVDPARTPHTDTTVTGHHSRSVLMRDPRQTFLGSTGGHHDHRSTQGEHQQYQCEKDDDADRDVHGEPSSRGRYQKPCPRQARWKQARATGAHERVYVSERRRGLLRPRGRSHGREPPFWVSNGA